VITRPEQQKSRVTPLSVNEDEHLPPVRAVNGFVKKQQRFALQYLWSGV